MRFESDNAAPAHPAVLAAIAEAGDAPGTYDNDRWSAALNEAFSQLFETAVDVVWATTGTAANTLALAALCPAYGGVICHEEAHIANDECGAPGFFTGGAQLLALDGSGAKLDARAVRAFCDGRDVDQHTLPPRCLSLTNSTEYGLVYSAAEMAEFGAVARAHGLRFHVDGARFANAVAASGASPADLSWRAGVDILSFGFSKNGGFVGEAMVLFDTALGEELRYRRKRAGHLPAKGRLIAAQIAALLEGDLWLANARAANAAATALAAAAPQRLLLPVEANALFLRLAAGEAAALREQGFGFYDWDCDATGGIYRLVTAWNTPAGDVAAMAGALRALENA
ncbi:MAG: low specificity L-threonine aldolase [Sphingomonadales bacterium]|nr:low specificity L-threonine aldolase [Sphingomonadales bacterium]